MTWKRFTVLGRTVRWLKEHERGTLAGRIFVSPDDEGRDTARISYHLPYAGCGASVSFRQDEGAIGFMLAFPPAGVWLTLDGDLARAAAKRVIDALPNDMRCSYSGRRFGLDLHNWAVWWDVGADDMGWSSRTPRWRHGSWHPLGHFCQQHSEVVEERAVLVPMPERSYRGQAQLTRERWGWDKLPRAFDRTLFRVDITMDKGEQIPKPGKGENSWDCDEDATYSLMTPARSIAEGVGHLVGSVLHDRRRHGGAQWTPQPRSIEASA